MPRGRRALLRKHESDDEFETPAFKVDEDKKEEESDSDKEPEFAESDASSDEDIDENIEHGTGVDGAASSDDSDGAPEDVGFSESRKTALSQMRDVMKQLKEDKQQLKAKRKLKDEKFKEQKKVKLEAIGRLSEELLNKLPEGINKPKVEEKRSKKAEKRKKKKFSSSVDDTESNEGSNPKTFVEESEDFIPLERGYTDSETGITAMSIKDLRKKMSVSQSAANFRNSRLYGDKRQRESTKSYLSKMEKKKYMKR